MHSKKLRECWVQNKTAEERKGLYKTIVDRKVAPTSTFSGLVTGLFDLPKYAMKSLSLISLSEEIVLGLIIL